MTSSRMAPGVAWIVLTIQDVRILHWYGYWFTMDIRAWLSEEEPRGNQGIFGFGSVSPAATRFLYSSVLSHALLVREIA